MPACRPLYRPAAHGERRQAEEGRPMSSAAAIPAEPVVIEAQAGFDLALAEGGKRARAQIWAAERLG
jgi:hypothetical protein